MGEKFSGIASFGKAPIKSGFLELLSRSMMQLNYFLKRSLPPARLISFSIFCPHFLRSYWIITSCCSDSFIRGESSTYFDFLLLAKDLPYLILLNDHKQNLN